MCIALGKRQDKPGTNQLIVGAHFEQKCEIAAELFWQIQQLFLLSYCIFQLQTSSMAENMATGIAALGTTLGPTSNIEMPLNKNQAPFVV